MWLLRKRRVRVHFLNDASPSIEGFFVGFWCGHYVIKAPSVIPRPGEDVPLGGPSVRVSTSNAWLEDL